jgi:hypothetical protein
VTANCSTSVKVPPLAQVHIFALTVS